MHRTPISRLAAAGLALLVILPAPAALSDGRRDASGVIDGTEGSGRATSRIKDLADIEAAAPAEAFVGTRYAASQMQLIGR